MKHIQIFGRHLKHCLERNLHTKHLYYKEKKISKTSAFALRYWKGEKIKPKVRNKGVKKIIAEISEVGNRKTIEKRNAPKKCFFCVKMNKIDKPKSCIIKEKKKREHPITNIRNERTSLVVQWLRLHTPNAGGMGWIPGEEIPHACMPLGMAKKKKRQ